MWNSSYRTLTLKIAFCPFSKMQLLRGKREPCKILGGFWKTEEYQWVEKLKIYNISVLFRYATLFYIPTYREKHDLSGPVNSESFSIKWASSKSKDYRIDHWPKDIFLVFKLLIWAWNQNFSTFNNILRIWPKVEKFGPNIQSKTHCCSIKKSRFKPDCVD